MAERARVDGIRNGSSGLRFFWHHPNSLIPVILHYDKYINFTGEAFIKFPSTLLAREAAQKLKGSQISAIPLENPVLVVDEDVKPSPASQKSSLVPSSISAALQPASVIITGVPYTWTHPNILSYLDAFRPDFFDAPEESVTRITVYVLRLCGRKILMIVYREAKVTRAGRWLVKLASLAEAHRIARHVNLARTRNLRRDEQDQTMFERRTLTCTVIY